MLVQNARALKEPTRAHGGDQPGPPMEHLHREKQFWASRRQGFSTLLLLAIVGIVLIAATAIGVALWRRLSNRLANNIDDQVIKNNFQIISKALDCHHALHYLYPSNLQSFDHQCLITGSPPANPYKYRGIDYEYQTTASGAGYMLRTQLSNGHIETTQP